MCLWSSIATYCLVFAVIQVLFPYLSCFHFIMLCDGIICTLLLQRRFFGFVSVDVRNFIRLKPGTHKIGGGCFIIIIAPQYIILIVVIQVLALLYYLMSYLEEQLECSFWRR